MPDSPLQRRFDHLQWTTAEAYATIESAEMGEDMTAIHAQLAKDLAEFAKVSRA